MSAKEASPQQKELVLRNLELVKGLSQRAAARVLGVSAQKVADWRNGIIPPLRSPMPEKLAANLEELDDDSSAQQSTARPSKRIRVDIPRSTPKSIVRQIDRVLNGPGGLSEKTCLIAEIAAAYRGSAYDTDASSSNRRAQAMLVAERRMLLREERDSRIVPSVDPQVTPSAEVSDSVREVS